MIQRNPNRRTRVKETGGSVPQLRAIPGAVATTDPTAIPALHASRMAPPADPAAALAVVGRDTLRAMVEAALPIARERASLLLEMRGALERGDERLALTLAYRLAGLNPPLSLHP